MSNRPRAAAAFGLAAALLASAPGCGDDPSRPPAGATVPVKGVVTYKGKPLTRGTLRFEPDAGREAQGEIGPDGSFALSTFTERDGAVPGVHRVAVVGLPRNILPVKFHNPGSSQVEVEVSAAKEEYAVDLK